MLSAHDRDIERGRRLAPSKDVRDRCARERERRLGECHREARGLGAAEVLGRLRDYAVMLRPPLYDPEALRSRARELGVAVPADWGTAMELVPVERRPGVAWARRVGDVALAAELGEGREVPPRGADPAGLVSLALYGRRSHRHLGHLKTSKAWELAEHALLLEGEPAADPDAALDLLRGDFRAKGDLAVLDALRPSTGTLPYLVPADASRAAAAVGARFKLPLWLRGSPHRALAFDTKKQAASALGVSGEMLRFAEGPVNSVLVVVVEGGGLPGVLADDGLWVPYDVDVRERPDLVRPADEWLRGRLAAARARRPGPKANDVAREWRSPRSDLVYAVERVPGGYCASVWWAGAFRGVRGRGPGVLDRIARREDEAVAGSRAEALARVDAFDRSFLGAVEAKRNGARR